MKVENRNSMNYQQTTRTTTFYSSFSSDLMLGLFISYFLIFSSKSLLINLIVIHLTDFDSKIQESRHHNFHLFFTSEFWKFIYFIIYTFSIGIFLKSYGYFSFLYYILSYPHPSAIFFHYFMADDLFIGKKKRIVLGL